MYRQVESVVLLSDALGLSAPLPPMRATWAIAPDSATLLVRLILERRPRYVLELGSGISTVLIARALQLSGGGRFRSLEQDPKYCQQTAEMLEMHGLTDAVELVTAEITDVTIGNDTWRWYSPAGLEGLESVDLVVVDGPPSRTGPQARYPAVPMTQDYLTEGALVFLDDADREDEQAIVQRWLAEFPLAPAEVPKTEKGVAVLEWRPSSKEMIL